MVREGRNMRLHKCIVYISIEENSQIALGNQLSPEGGKGGGSRTLFFFSVDYDVTNNVHPLEASCPQNLNDSFQKWPLKNEEEE